MTPGSQSRIQPLWQRLQPLPQIQLFERLLDARIADTPVEKCQIVADAGMEELHILRNHADMAAQIFQTHSAKLLSIEENTPRSSIVTAEEPAAKLCVCISDASHQSPP